MTQSVSHSRDLQAVPRITQDSRGRDTLEVTLRLGHLQGVGDVPAGASKGEDEAQTVEIALAQRNMTEVILPLWRQLDVDLRQHASIVTLEEAMIARAGQNFADLGANATLPMSRALWRLASALHNVPLHAYISEAEPTVCRSRRVFFFMNIFNGGLHALKKGDGETLGRDRIDIQEIMVVPTAAPTYREAMAVGERIDASLKALLERTYGADKVSRADEAGFSVRGLGDSDQAIAHVFTAIKDAGLRPGTDVKIALDVAASSFYTAATQTYQMRGQALSSQQMVAYLCAFAERYAGFVMSIEDGLAENDWPAWRHLTAEMHKRQILTIGDDLFVTQIPRLQKGIADKSAHAILVKVNQNGTVHGTLQVIKMAQQSGMQWVVSHRSGETLDDSISDLAAATGAFGLKAGDPQPAADFPNPKAWVRRSKYLRMVAIEEGA